MPASGQNQQEQDRNRESYSGLDASQMPAQDAARMWVPHPRRVFVFAGRVGNSELQQVSVHQRRGIPFCSKRSAKSRSLPATVRRAVIDSLRTWGTTASFTYAMAWRSSISISSMASSMRVPAPPTPELGGG